MGSARKLEEGGPREIELRRLKPSPRNKRTITKEKADDLARSLAAAPGMQRARPIIALPSGTIVAGHQRFLVLKAAKAKTAWVYVADLPPDEADEWMLRDNRPFGQDDEPAIAGLLAELQERGADVAAIGYDADEIDDLLAAAGQVPDLPVEPFAGGFAESPGELADRAGRGDGPAPAGDPLREVRLMLKPRVHTTFIRNVNALAEVYGKKGIIDTVVEAVKREHAEHVGRRRKR